MTERLKIWAENIEKIVEEQASFRRDYNTIDDIFCHPIPNAGKPLQEKENYASFVDFRKPFDCQ